MGNGELVPAAVGPKPVHRVEHVEQRQIAVQRQSVPGRRADFGEGNVRLMIVDVVNGGFAGTAHEGACQAIFRARAVQVLEQC